jgi:hypothetical protein
MVSHTGASMYRCVRQIRSRLAGRPLYGGIRKPQPCRFFDIAHGSSLECAAGLDILVAKGKLTNDQIRAGKETLQKIVRMLMGLIKRNSTREYEKTSRAGRDSDRGDAGSPA